MSNGNTEKILWCPLRQFMELSPSWGCGNGVSGWVQERFGYIPVRQVVWYCLIWVVEEYIDICILAVFALKFLGWVWFCGWSCWACMLLYSCSFGCCSLLVCITLALILFLYLCMGAYCWNMHAWMIWTSINLLDFMSFFITAKKFIIQRCSRSVCSLYSKTP